MEFIKDLLSNIKSSYVGNYTVSSIVLNEMRREVKNISIPTMKDDKENLKNDVNNVVRDLRNVAGQYKSNGKTK
jgi:hypothetical protein